MNKIIVFSFAILTATAGLFQSCKKFTNLPPYNETYSSDTLANGKRKMLIIAIDGIRGQELQNDSGKLMPTVWSLLPHSKYTFVGVADEATNNSAAIAALLNGVSSSVSGVKDSTLQVQSNPNDPEASSQPTLSVLARLTDANPFLSIAAITPWRQFSKRFLSYANMNYVTTGDGESKDSAVSVLKNSNADLVFVHLNGAEIAGEANDFVFSDPNYKQAINNTDNYIKSIMDALQNRKHYNDGKENWTVVIMSNTGGNKGTAAQQKNIFSLYYNKGFTTQAFNPVVSTALRVYGDVNGTGSNAGVLVQSGTTTNTNFDVPYLKALTVEYRLKLNAVPGANDNGFATNSPYIIGTQSTRGTSLTGTAGGWTSTMLWYNNTRMRFFPFQANNIIVGNPVDGAWHTYTEVMFSNNVNSKDSVRVRTYYDGVFQAAAVSAGQTVTGSAPLAIGYRPPAATNLPDFCINDIRIWKTTMTDDEVKANYNLKDATKHPYYSSMVGWWPCDEGGGDTLHSKFATTASDFVVKKATGATTQWKLINSAPATFGPANTDQLIRNTSLCPNLLYWFNVPIGTGWKPVYDNAIWLDQYLIEFSR